MSQSNPKKAFSGLSRDTFLLAFASLFSDISTEMLYPILPIFLTQTLHTGGSIVGLIDGIAQAAQNIMQGVSGWLSDQLQKRKAVALSGYMLAALAKPLMGFATIWQGVLGARLLDRLGSGIRSAPRDALIASSVSETNRGKAFGLEGIGDNLGACLGPILTVLLLAWLPGKLRLIFYLAIIPGLLAFFMITQVKERPVKVEAKAKLEFNLRHFPKAYWKYLLATAIFGIGNSSNAFLILQTRSIGISLEKTILIYAGFNLVAALISYPAGFLSDRFGRKKILLASFAAFLATYLGFALSKDVLLIAFLFMVYGLYQGIFRSVGKALATDFVPEAFRASGVGWYTATIGLMELMASIVAGLLWDHVSHTAVFLYGALFAGLGSLAFLALVHE